MTFCRLRDGGKLCEARVGHFDDADIRIDGAERIVLRRDPALVKALKRVDFLRLANERFHI